MILKEIQPIIFTVFISLIIYSIIKLIATKNNFSNLMGFEFSSINLRSFILTSFLGFCGFCLLFIINYMFGYLTITGANEIFPILSQAVKGIAAAFTEELIYRGLFYLGVLFIYPNKLLALFISSICIAFMHSGTNSTIDHFSDFIAGIMYGVAFLKYKSIWASIGLHFSWNFFQSFFGFPVSGQLNKGLFHTNISDSFIFNGGEFGPEKSVIGISLMLIFIIIILLHTHYLRDIIKKDKTFLNLEIK